MYSQVKCCYCVNVNQSTWRSSSYLDFKCEILLKILYNHDQKWQLYAQCLLRVCWTCDVGGAVEVREIQRT